MIEVAKSIHAHLGSPFLPNKLLDDRRNRIEPDSRSEEETLMAHFDEDSLHALKTVRFLKDFMKYKAAPDLETKNESFLRTAELFRLQGNKNYYFLLQLNNPLLKGIDPYDPDLTSEQMVMVTEECRTNFWYFLREVCKLKPRVKFKANRGNISFIWAYLNHLTTYMIMPRQQGKMQERGTLILKSDGTWVKIEDLRFGDELMTVDGETSRVIGLHGHKNKRLYRVKTSDGRELNTGAEHLWTVFDKNRGRTGGWVDYSTAQIIELHKQDDYDDKSVSIPLINPCEFPDKDLLDPYFMGFYYGGYTHVSGSEHKNLDSVLRERLEEHNPGMYNFRVDGDATQINNSYAQIMLLNERIPTSYINSSVKQRHQLIQGIIDAKGSIVDSKVFIELSDTLLRKDVQYIVRSLGGTAKDTGEGLFVTLMEDMDYFKYRDVEVPEQDNTLYIESFEYCHHNDAYCIEVDSQDQLYVTEDFIVTHNTVSVQVINFWLTYIVGRGYKSHVITLKSDNRAQFIEAIKGIRSSIPQYLVNTTYRDKDAGTYLTYRSFGESETNVLTISVPQQGEAAAGDLGRGLTVESTTIDEPAYIPWIKAIVDGCMPSALTAMENARTDGLPHSISYITTPNTILHASGEYMYDKVMGATEWREKFFDSYSESHLCDRLIKASPKVTTSPAISMVYNYMQLGKGPEWVRETMDKLGLSLSKSKIDLLLMWVEDGEDKLFDDVTRAAINNNKRDAVWSKEYKKSGLFLDFFISKEEFVQMCSPNSNDHVLIGCDTSSAIDQDACTVVLRSYRTGATIGVGRYPLAFLDDVGGVLLDILVNVENSLLVIERNYAHHMIDSLLISLTARGLDPFQKIFNQIYQDPIRYKKELEDIRRTRLAVRDKDFYLKYKKHFGFNTNASSRATLYGFIQEAVGNTGYAINYSKLCDELINLRVKGGRIDHDLNKHDDLVIAWLLSYWFIKLGNSKSLYGVPPGIGLTQTRNLLSANDDNMDAKEDPEIVKFVDALREKVRELSEELMSTKDNILAFRLEAEIVKLSKLIPEQDNRHAITIDSILEDAKVERLKRLRNKRVA